MPSRRHLLCCAAALAFAHAARAQTDPLDAAPPSAAEALPYLQREDVQQFIDEVVDVHGLDRAWVESVLAQGRYSEQAERLTTPALAPPASRNWLDYRTRNVDERRVREGLAFFHKHRSVLARASARFGVPEPIMVSIIGIETRFGRLMGSFRTLDVLLTLSFDYPRRALLYREELAQFLLMCQEMQIDPLGQRGSFAGAVGLPQFMPGSVRRFAIDFDGDGRIDLAGSAADAIGSVACFLAAHGWEPDRPIQFAASAPPEVVDALGRGIEAEHRWGELAALGVTIEGVLDAEARVLLLDLPLLTSDGDEGVEYRVGTANMSALLHYNRSYFYGAAVGDLADAIVRRTLA